VLDEGQGARKKPGSTKCRRFAAQGRWNRRVDWEGGKKAGSYNGRNGREKAAFAGHKDRPQQATKSGKVNAEGRGRSGVRFGGPAAAKQRIGSADVTEQG